MRVQQGELFLRPVVSLTSPVNAQLQTEWSINNFVESSASANWQIMSRVENEIDLKWQFRSYISSVFFADWKILAIAEKQANFRWNVGEQGGQGGLKTIVGFVTVENARKFSIVLPNS